MMRIEQTEFAKWIAFVAMVVDHVGELWDIGCWSGSLGRVVYPVFVYCLCVAYAGAEWGRIIKAVKRLVVFAVCAQVVSPIGLHAITGNVLFTFAVGLLLWACVLERLYFPALVIWLISGAVVEYWWIGLALQLTCLAWMRWRHPGWLAAMLGALGALWWLNGDWMTLGAVLVVLVARVVPVFPRSRFTFAYLYAVHLGFLAAVIRISS